MSMSRKKCCVPRCMDSGKSHNTMHLFPNPATDIQRFNQWVFSIGGDIIGLKNEDVYKHRSVCHAHFEERYCCRYNRLSKIAVPTLNLPGPISLPKFTFDERRPMRQMQNLSLPLADAESSTAVSTSTAITTLEPSACLSVHFIKQENMDAVPKQPVSNTNAPPQLMEKDCHRIEAATNVIKTIKKHMRVSQAEHILYKKLIQARIILSKCRNILEKKSISLEMAKNITSNPALLATMENLSNAEKLLTLMPFRDVKQRNKGKRFSMQETILALSIFIRAPKGYRFLRKVLILPAPQTLAKVISQAEQILAMVPKLSQN